MHSNNTQVQVQIPAFYLGSVAMSASLGFSGGGSNTIEHNHPTSTLHPFHPATTAHAHHYHSSHSNNNSNNGHGHHHHSHHSTTNPPSPVHHQSSSSSSPHSTSISTSVPYHGYNAADLHKTFESQVDIYQPPPQPQDQELLTPMMNRHLNNNHASNYHAPHHSYNQHYVAHQQYSSASSPYHNYPKQQPQHQQQQQQQSTSSSPASSVHTQPQSSQQLDSPYSNAATPTPSLSSTMSTTVSSASTPSLASNVSTLQHGSDYDHHSNNGGLRTESRQTASPGMSPVTASTSTSFHIPASPEELPLGASHLSGSPRSMGQAMSNWTPNQESEMPSQDAHAPTGAGKADRSSPYYAQSAQTSTLYSQQDSQAHAQQQQTQAQSWVASMSNDDFHTSSQELLDQHQGRQQSNQRASTQSSRADDYSYSQGSSHQGPSVPSQQMCALPLLSPATLLQSDYQAPSSYAPGSMGMGMQEAPTLLSHVDYNRMSSSSMAPPSVASSGTNKGRYGGPIRTHKKRNSSIGSHRELGTRTRTNSVNSTSSAASSGILSLTSNMGSASMNSRLPDLSTTFEELDEATEAQSAKFNMFQDEEEDSDSPTTIVNRPRANTAPRKAVAARVFECSIPGCTKAYTQLHNLKSHERTGHTPVIKLKPFRCIIEGCIKAFSQRKSLAIHIKNAHKEFKFKPFKCHQFGCDKAYTQLHNLRTHEKTVHLLDLSRKRVKNPNGADDDDSLVFGQQQQQHHNGHYGQQQQQQHHHYQQQPQHHQHSRQHSDMGLSYGDMNGLSDLVTDRDSMHHHSSSYPSHHHQQQQQQHHHQQQQQHHTQAYSRLPHLGAMSSMMMHDRS
ncbi:hypothetical protein EMPS_02579 [Entomortierella parvispora]|uniref:C2H2-type domain-containing protein n=1 Tax=Entomortierella parvispora TaxID=205924 RepID=A0A9P3H502_9FUNG|nr:hypothetical protein EMPS_02579 [Entomortierella parvispora]